MQNIKSTLYITFERWFSTVAGLLVRLLSLHDSFISSDNLAGNLRSEGKSCENILIFSSDTVQQIIPDRLG